MSFSLHRGHADKAWGENVITLTTFLRPSMHFGPWSSTGSHSLGQSTALSTSTTMDTCWASLRSWFLDSMSSLICRGRGRVSASSWSIAKVKLNLPLMHVQFTCKCMRSSRANACCILLLEWLHSKCLLSLCQACHLVARHS